MTIPIVSSSKVFGVSTYINSYSYVDRANLDRRFKLLLSRDGHIAIKGPSKCGKSWLRQSCMDNAVVVQCRLDMTPEDIYKQALDAIGVRFDVQRSTSTTLAGSASADGKVTLPLLAKAEVDVEVSGSREWNTGIASDYSCSIDNLEFIANAIIKSGKRLVIEDFHYLSLETREKLAHDLKTLWDYQCFVIIIGVWTQTNLLTYLNPDLTARIEEISISWAEEELRQVIEKGSAALNIAIDSSIQDDLIKDSFGNVGILQKLLLLLMDEAEIYETCTVNTLITNPVFYTQAARAYANQLDGLYQKFATTLSAGIRRRKRSTGIYALAMQAIVEAEDDQLINGFSRTEIFDKTHAQEERIQKGNLKTVLKKLVELQEPAHGHTLVISYDESIDAVFAIDLQLLFYRKHHSMKWPWEEIAEEARQQSLFDDEEE